VHGTSEIVLGVLTLVLTSISTVFQDYYGFGTGTVGLVYLGLGLGSLTGALFLMAASDRLMKRQEAKAGHCKAEYRLGFVPVDVVLIPIGFFLYGWTVEHQVQYVVPILGTLLMGIGNNMYRTHFLLSLHSRQTCRIRGLMSQAACSSR
jgi:hypothetical protein